MYYFTTLLNSHRLQALANAPTPIPLRVRTTSQRGEDISFLVKRFANRWQSNEDLAYFVSAFRWAQENYPQQEFERPANKAKRTHLIFMYKCTVLEVLLHIINALPPNINRTMVESQFR